jgi:hypothetical protein
MALREGLEFREFVLHRFLKDLWTDHYWFVGPQWEFIFDAEGKPMMDFVGRFERLQEDFCHVCQALNLPPLEVPHVNKSKKKRWRQHFRPHALLAWFKKGAIRPPVLRPKYYQEYYDKETKDVVAELFLKDIELFQYEFGTNGHVRTSSGLAEPSAV